MTKEQKKLKGTKGTNKRKKIETINLFLLKVPKK
jgi:hypothetical protein